MSTHDTDFYTWTQEQAALLRAGRLADLDIAGLLEEVEDMGRSERRELVSRLVVLLMHLLKWKYQPSQREYGQSWRLTIEEQRLSVREELEDNPGLKPMLKDAIDKAYARAILQAAKETRLPKAAFPANCPWEFEQVMDDDFWPG